MEMRWRIELLGELRVRPVGADGGSGGRAITRFQTQKIAVLLAYLAYPPDRSRLRDALIDLLWPDVDPRDGRNSLSVSLSWLRRQLEPPGVPAGAVLVADRSAVRLDPDAVTTDVAEFEAALQAAVGTGTGAERAALLTRAVELYRGELLPGHYDDWILPEREWLAQRYLQALHQLISHLEQAGELERALEYARHGVSADPLREEGHCDLMRLYAASGQPAAALRQYRALERLLKEELGEAPAPATLALVREIERMAALRLAAPGSAPPLSPSAPKRGGDPGVAARGNLAQAEAPAVFPHSEPRAASREPAEGENRLVTVLFADMCRSLETTRELSPEDGAELVNRLLQAMVDVLLKYEGRVDRFLGDGLLAVFGMPMAHEDDPERAVRAALEIREAARRLGVEVRAGINTGVAYAGEMGSERHRELTVMGPAVSLAARLQDAAQAGQILLGESTYQLTRRAFAHQPFSLAVKGMPQPVPVFAVERALPHPEKARGIEGLRAELIGRGEEMAKLREGLAGVLAGRGGIISIIGEAGVGKSRLVSELKLAALACRVPSAECRAQPRLSESRPASYAEVVAVRGTRHSALGTRAQPLWLEGRCVELGASASYGLFVDLLRGYFGIAPEEGERARGERIVSSLRELQVRSDLSPEQFEEIGPPLGHLLSACFETRWDDWLRGASPEEVKRQAFTAIREFLVALTRSQPVVLVGEDLHWADTLSLDLIALLMDTLPCVPLLLVCVYRPERERKCWRLGTIAAQKCSEQYTELHLRELTPAQSRRLVESLLIIEDLPAKVKDLILDRSRGNPFFVEEVIRSLIASGLVYPEGEEPGARRWRAREEIGAVTVPESIQSVIASRVDRLVPELKQVLQRASVIGRVFPRRLLEAATPSGADLERALWVLEEQALIYQERVIPEEEYSFKHVLTQETVYQSILRRRRAALHQRVAEAMEQLYAENLEAHCEPLAHHCAQGGLTEKAIAYSLQAGERARRLNASAEAVQHLQQALTLLDGLPQDEPHLRRRWQAVDGLQQVYLSLQEHHRANELLREYLNLAESAGFPWGIAAAHLQMSWVAWGSGWAAAESDGADRNESIIEHCEQCLRICEQHGLPDWGIPARRQLAIALTWRDAPRAEALLRQALELGSGLPPMEAIYRELVVFYVRHAKWEEAVAAFREGFPLVHSLPLPIMEDEFERMGRRADFLAHCEEAQRLHAQAGIPYSLNQWYLEPGQPSEQFRDLLFADDFDAPHLREVWQWHDVHPPSESTRAGAYSLSDRPGFLTLHAPRGADLWPQQNLNAPRLLLEARGDFAVETRMEGDWEQRDSGGSGLLLWKDALHFLRFEKEAADPTFRADIQFQGRLKGDLELLGRGRLCGTTYTLRLERSGERVNAFCSIDGVNWLTCGTAIFPVRDPVLVGVTCRMGVVAHFDYVRVLGKANVVSP